MSRKPVHRWSCGFVVRLIVLAGLLAAQPGGRESHAADLTLSQIQASLRSRLDGEAMASSLACRGETICGIEMLPLAYRSRDYRPLWLDASLRLQSAEAMADAIRRAAEDGLVPSDYHLIPIQNLLSAIGERSSTSAPVPPDWWVDLELLLTDTFLLYGSHLAAGRVNPETLHTDWKIDPGTVALLPLLIQAATTGDVDAALNGLRPTHRGYNALREILARYRAVADAGGWPVLADHQTLRPGQREPAVEGLRRRLIAEGDLDSKDPDGDAQNYDAVLVEAVRRYQRRHGVEADGIVGPDTIAMMNVPVDGRIRQVILNLERWRWLPRDLGDRFIMVNTADFGLAGVENGRTMLQMRVVVGRPARRSPVFSARMTYLVVNPYWNIPTTIAVEDLLPQIQKDVSYLTRRGIHVYKSWRTAAPEVDPTTVDWDKYHAGWFPFRLRQDPGPFNALGRIKFMFANEFAVYLHDTPDRSLFNQVQRDLSSGCIRLEAPLVLADFVLKGDSRWSHEALEALIETGETKTIRLGRPIPVHLAYMTAWADETGAAQFRNDIYDRDGALFRAINRPGSHRPAYLTHQMDYGSGLPPGGATE